MSAEKDVSGSYDAPTVSSTAVPDVYVSRQLLRTGASDIGSAGVPTHDVMRGVVQLRRRELVICEVLDVQRRQ